MNIPEHIFSKLTDEQNQTADKLNSLQDQKYQTEIKIAKNDTQLETFKEKLLKVKPLHTLTAKASIPKPILVNIIEINPIVLLIN